MVHLVFFITMTRKIQMYVPRNGKIDTGGMDANSIIINGHHCEIEWVDRVENAAKGGWAPGYATVNNQRVDVKYIDSARNIGIDGMAPGYRIVNSYRVKVDIYEP
jgi:hypothetical protein